MLSTTDFANLTVVNTSHQSMIHHGREEDECECVGVSWRAHTQIDFSHEGSSLDARTRLPTHTKKTRMDDGWCAHTSDGRTFEFSCPRRMPKRRRFKLRPPHQVSHTRFGIRTVSKTSTVDLQSLDGFIESMKYSVHLGW